MDKKGQHAILTLKITFFARKSRNAIFDCFEQPIFSHFFQLFIMFLLY